MTSTDSVHPIHLKVLNNTQTVAKLLNASARMTIPSPAHYARTAASSQMRRDMPCSNSSTTAHSQVCLQLSSDTRLAPTEHLPAINTALALQLQERCNVSDALLATAAVSASATVERQRLRCVHICISSSFSSFSIGDCAACASAAAVAVGP
jgi:hypothetical protein